MVGVYYFSAGSLCSYPNHKPNPNPSHAGGPTAFKDLLLGLHFTVVFCILHYIHSCVYITETSAAILDLLLQYGSPKCTRNSNSDPNPCANPNPKLTLMPNTVHIMPIYKSIFSTRLHVNYPLGPGLLSINKPKLTVNLNATANSQRGIICSVTSVILVNSNYN